MRKLTLTLSLLSFVSLQVLGAQAAQDRTDWKQRGTFHIVTTPGGAEVPADVTVKDFPLLVRLTRDFFDFSQAQPDGGDLRFEAADGSDLAYEIEQWDPAAGVAAVWVRMPAIMGNRVQAVQLYWGNPSCASASDGKAVFNASNGYAAVWHLGREVRDVTGNLESHDTGTLPTAGTIGLARHFPKGKRISCGRDIQALPVGDGPHTTQAWFQTGEGHTQVLFWGNEKPRGKVTMWYNSPPSIRMDCWFSDGNVKAPLPDHAGGWIHVVHTYGDEKATLYLNGRKGGEGNPGHQNLNIERPAGMHIGGPAFKSDFEGDIDEVRVSSVARSEHWVRLEYENQKPMQTLVGPLVPDGSKLSLSAARTTLHEGETVDITAQVEGAQKIYWTLQRKDAEETVAVDCLAYRFAAGRVNGDESVTLRLKALYPAGMKTRELHFAVKERIPDPVFRLKAPDQWDGRETIEFVAEIQNLAEMQNRGAGDVHYAWTVSDMATIRRIEPGKLILTRAQNSGTLTVMAVVHNGGEKVSASKTIHVQQPASDPWVYRSPEPGEKPMDGQFYARNHAGKGTMHCNGTTDRQADHVFLKLYANGKLVDQQSQPTSKGAAYSFAVPLKAGLITYRMELGFKSGTTETLVHTADDIVCGDAYLIDGQSNALATDTRDESPRETYQWVRSFGGPTGRADATHWVENEYNVKQMNLWCRPVWKFEGGAAREASREKHKAELGWWGMVLARKLVESQKTPICIIQAAVGGTRIDEHQRNENNPLDLGTMYGRMLWRVKEARLTHGIRAIMWHQGENDQRAFGPDGCYGWVNYQRYFIDMSAGWKRDFPNVSHYYVFQIWPNSCAMGTGNGDMLREKQRTLPRYYSNMSILSTLGVRPPGPAHFPLEGWAVFADRLQPLIERDFYGSRPVAPLTAPNLKRAFRTGDKGIALEFDQPVTWKPELVREFRLNGKKGLVASGSLRGNVLTLELTGPLHVNEISYIDEMDWSQDRLLVGANGIAALTFCNVPVEEAAE